MEYRARLTHDTNGTILVSFPDFPEAATVGASREDALRHAVDALETVIDAYMHDKRPIPGPTKAKAKGEAIVRLPAMVAAKVELYGAMRAAKLTKYALAKRLDWHVPQVDRLFDVRHQSKVEQLEAAAAALGKHVEIRMV